MMNSFCSFVYKSTAQDYIGRDKQANNKSVYQCYKHTFTELSRHLNKSLYNKLERLRKDEGVDFSTFIHVNNLTEHNLNERMCDKLKKLIVALNNDFMGWCYQNYTFYNILTEEQREKLFNVIIDNDFIFYALILIDNTSERSNRTNIYYTQLKEKYNEFETNFQNVFGTDMTFQHYFYNIKGYGINDFM